MRRFLIISLVLVVGVGLGVMIFLLTRGSPPPLLKADAQYAMTHIRPNTFRDATWDSYLTFNDDFSIMSLEFATRKYHFTILRINQRQHSANATVLGIIGGQLVHIDVTANRNQITFRAMRDYVILIETADEDGHPQRETISRNSILLQFSIGGEG